MLPKILYNADEVINELSSLAKSKNLVFREYGKQTELYPIMDNILVCQQGF